MMSQTTFRVLVLATLFVVLGTLAGQSCFTTPRLARAQGIPEQALEPRQQQPSSSGRRPGATDASGRGATEDEKVIRAVDDAFVREYNQGDSQALAARFTEDAEAIEADGERYQGRDLIGRRFAETFAESPGVKISLEIGAIRFLTPDVAKEEGRSLITSAKGQRLVRPYTVLYVKRGGRWLISSVREESEPQLGARAHLKELNWMIGEWVDEGQDSVVRFDCRWSPDGNFVLRGITVKVQGKPVLTVSQRIGWDPVARQIRSWDFDSEGGFGEGKWSRDGERWVIRHTATSPEGTTATGVNIMTRERPDLVRWVSTARVLGDESFPDEESYVLVRVPPAPGAQSKGLTPSTPSPNTERSPR
jgi:uncharacterized protein (TIGR02246 family)